MSNPDDPHTAEQPPVVDYAQPRPENEVVRIATYTDPVEAELARAKLDAEGIRCFVGNENQAAVLGGYGPAFSKTDVNVAKSDEHAAREILDSIAAAREARHRHATQPDKCPQCGSTILRRSRGRASLTVSIFTAGFLATCFTGNPLWLLLTMVPGAYLILTLDRAPWICTQCHHRLRFVPPPSTDDVEG